jgi:methanogenic corrinoid protein MtbC1
MVFCVQGEEHSIGAKMVSSIFKESGWDTRYLGANLPVKDSVIYANIWRPDVIGISLSLIYNLPTLLECLKELNQLDYNPEIIVGGRITSLYQLKNYCPSNIVVIEDLYQFRSWLKANKLCERAYAYN